jgi:hypothetical protein
MTGSPSHDRVNRDCAERGRERGAKLCAGDGAKCPRAREHQPEREGRSGIVQATILMAATASQADAGRSSGFRKRAPSLYDCLDPDRGSVTQHLGDAIHDLIRVVANADDGIGTGHIGLHQHRVERLLPRALG